MRTPLLETRGELPETETKHQPMKNGNKVKQFVTIPPTNGTDNQQPKMPACR